MKNSTQLWKSMLAKVLVVVMVMLSVLVVPTTEASAATAPKLNKSACSILVDKQYDLNVLNKVKGSAYVWTTSNAKVAKVNKAGVITGVNKGTAVITCKVKAAKKTYTLTAKVTVIQPANRVKISNKITTINVGKTYDLNRMLIPSSSNEKTTWSSSDATIAAPDKSGKFTALKAGTVTITAKTTSGLKDSVTINVIDEAVATTQEELNSLLASGAPLVTIKTDAEVNLTIQKGDYSKTKLVVEAPKADITNYGVFASIDIKKIKADTWREEAVGNLLTIFAEKSRVVVGVNAVCNIEVNEKGATLTIENNGVIEKVTISKEAAQASLDIKGESKKDVPVVVNVPDVKIKTSVPLNLECEKKIELTILPGAEKTQVTAKTEDAVPTVKGSVTLEVKVGTGENAKKATITGAPIPTAAPTTAPSNPSSGNPSPSNPGTPNNTTETKIITLEQSYENLKSVTVKYAGLEIPINEGLLTSLKNYLKNDQTTIKTWQDCESTTKNYSGQEVKVTGTKGSNTKQVEFTNGLLSGRKYEVTVDGSNSQVTIKSLANSKTFVVKKIGEQTLSIAGVPVDVEFKFTYQ